MKSAALMVLALMLLAACCAFAEEPAVTLPENPDEPLPFTLTPPEPCDFPGDDGSHRAGSVTTNFSFPVTADVVTISSDGVYTVESEQLRYTMPGILGWSIYTQDVARQLDQYAAVGIEIAEAMIRDGTHLIAVYDDPSMLQILVSESDIGLARYVRSMRDLGEDDRRTLIALCACLSLENPRLVTIDGLCWVRSENFLASKRLVVYSTIVDGHPVALYVYNVNSDTLDDEALYAMDRLSVAGR